MKNQNDTFVIYNKNTGKRYGTKYGSYQEWKTVASAKGALTRLNKKHLKEFLDHCNEHMDYITECYKNGHAEKRGWDWDNKFATAEGRLAYIEEMKEYRCEWKAYDGLCGSEVVTYDYFYENEPMVERTNISCGTKYMERLNTPSFLSPSCDSYYR